MTFDPLMMDDLKRLLHSLMAGRISVPELRAVVTALFKAGKLRPQVPQQARTAFENFIWYVDLFDPKLRPRKGFLGRIKDLSAQTIRGEYRLSEDAVRTAAERLLLALETDEKRRGS